MSIPKEPRQLMINLMYLVLTALLALNISAEVMNAFFTLDKGIKQSNGIIENTNLTLLGNIQKQADAYKNEKNDQFLAAAKDVKKTADEFVTYIDDLKKELFDAAGGASEKNPDQPKRIKDKDVTTRLLVGLEKQPGKGYELEQKIRDTRTKLEELVGKDPATVSSMPLAIDDEAVKKSDKKDWVEYNFFQMPVAAVFPILTKIQNDAKASSTTALNYLLGKVAGEDIKFDAFEPVVSASKGYVIRGEKYTADVFLSAFSTSAGDNTRISVNGSNLPVKDGKATYETTTSGIGTKKYSVKIDVVNPITNEVKSYTKEFEYEVGERSVAVSAEKMNVFYIGVDNPVVVSAAGISSNDLSVSISGGGGSIKKVGSANYVVNVTTPGDCRVNVSGGGLRDSKPFRVKRIPDPVARLSKSSGGAMGNGEFKAQGGVGAFLDNFDFDATCQIQGFTLVYVASRQDPVEIINAGARYNDAAQRMVQKAKPGDIYYFDDVKARCPGDNVGRPINSMVFKIK
ncbi:MAG: gliding motility protein GldM [Phaeodactylibacter sp.]|nr:gliding motility protein GldM [Phaeodactylibacter sp.]MCB9302806.1 gliding motility protein GldM [Lewinellaceae bacterium]